MSLARIEDVGRDDFVNVDSAVALLTLGGLAEAWAERPAAKVFDVAMRVWAGTAESGDRSTAREMTFNVARRRAGAKERLQQARRTAPQAPTPQSPRSLGAFRARSAGGIPGRRHTPKSGR